MDGFINMQHIQSILILPSYEQGHGFLPAQRGNEGVGQSVILYYIT